MGRRGRRDVPGMWHHVANRGIAKRSVFERIEDERYFLSRIARVHRLGLLETYAYCLMINHFHLLVRSPVGRLAEAMRLLQNPFVRRFNRDRRRDGPLFRGRYISRPIGSETDWWTVFRYIHLNPVKAGIVTRAEEYPHSSAAHLVQPGPRPRWLLRQPGLHADHARARSSDFFSRVFAQALSAAEENLVERRFRAPQCNDDPLDLLLAGGSSDVRAWLERKAELADGTGPTLPLVAPEMLMASVADASRGAPDLVIRPGRKSCSLWPVLLAGLLRGASGLPFTEIAARLDCSASTAHARHKEHRRQVLADPSYAELAAEILTRTLRATVAPVLQPRRTDSG